MDNAGKRFGSRYLQRRRQCTSSGRYATPAISFLTSEVKANAGVVISASHNPFEDNGIKFFSQTGHKLPDAVEDEIAAIVAAPIDYTQAVSGSSVGQIIHEKDLSALYIKHILSTAYAKLNGLKIVMDCSNGANSEIAPVILRSLGAEVVAIFNDLTASTSTTAAAPLIWRLCRRRLSRLALM
mgnify:CR=1 FL=1